MMEINCSFLQKKFFYLLISLIVYFLTNALLAAHGINIYIFDILFLIVIFFCIYSVANKLIAIFFSVPLGAISIISHWMINATTMPTKEIILVHYLSNSIFLGLVTCLILNSVARQKKITLETLFAAICSYFLIGLTWASIYQVIAILNPDAFSIVNPNLASHSILIESTRAQAQYFIYFSYVTLTTIGYGDILAISNIAKTFSWLEAMTGQIFLVVWISQLVSQYVVAKQKEQHTEAS